MVLRQPRHVTKGEIFGPITHGASRRITSPALMSRFATMKRPKSLLLAIWNPTQDAQKNCAKLGQSNDLRHSTCTRSYGFVSSQPSGDLSSNKPRSRTRNTSAKPKFRKPRTFPSTDEQSRDYKINRKSSERDS